MKKQRIIGVTLFLIGILLNFFVELVADEIKRNPWYIQNRTWILSIGALFILLGIFLTFVNITKLRNDISELRKDISRKESKGTGDLTFLDNDQKFLNEQLECHQENLRKLLRQKSIYAAGEEPLHLLNQIAAEEKEIQKIEHKLQNLGA